MYHGIDFALSQLSKVSTDGLIDIRDHIIDTWSLVLARDGKRDKARVLQAISTALSKTLVKGSLNEEEIFDVDKSRANSMDLLKRPGNEENARFILASQSRNKAVEMEKLRCLLAGGGKFDNGEDIDPKAERENHGRRRAWV